MKRLDVRLGGAARKDYINKNIEKLEMLGQVRRVTEKLPQPC